MSATSRKARILGLVAAIVGLVVGLLASPSHAATGWHSDNQVGIWGSGGDSWFNYDFGTQSSLEGNVDWPITFMWAGNATHSKVDSGMAKVGFGSGGSDQYLQLADSPNAFFWDHSSGHKECKHSSSTSGCLSSCPNYDAHYRIYSNTGGVPLYNVSYGYYFVGSMHFDDNEGCSASYRKFYGYTETAETQEVTALKSVSGLGWGITLNYFGLGNCTSRGVCYADSSHIRKESNASEDHYWDSDGKVTYINIP